jgi:hypothetical protein
MQDPTEPIILSRLDEIDEVPDDTILWRYIDLAGLIWMLTERALVFRSPRSFEDNFEGAWPPSAIEQIQNKVLHSHHHLFDGPFLDVAHVCCWHGSPHENYLMWKAYGPLSGVAIRTTAGALRSALPENFVAVRQIRYVDFTNEPCSPVNILEPLLRKRLEFSAENEVRVLTIGADSSPSPLVRVVDKDRIAHSIDPEKLIVEIVLSHQISFLKAGVEQILSSLGFSIPLRLSRLSESPTRVLQERG